MKITVKQLKALIKEQFEEVRASANMTLDPSHGASPPTENSSLEEMLDKLLYVADKNNVAGVVGKANSIAAENATRARLIEKIKNDIIRRFGDVEL